jgi:predicted dehydrogenase
MKTGLVILGAGRWGLHLVRNFLEHPHAHLIAVVEPNGQRLDYCQQKFNLSQAQITLAQDWELVKHNPQIEAVVIATPASTHYALIKDALNLGYHVLAEKPLTLDPLECAELTRIATQKKLQLLVDHTYLFNPAVNKGQQIIKAGELGKLRYGYASRTNLGPVRQDVDALWDLAIHDLAIFNHWLGQMPVKVQARGQVWLQPPLADLVWVKLIYPHDFIANIHLCWLNPDKQRKLCLVGTKGTLVFDEMCSQSPLSLQRGYFHKQEDNFIPTGVQTEVLEVEKAEPLKIVCDRFLTNIRNQTEEQLSSGRLATDLVKILQALSLSLQQNGQIIKL